MVAQTYINLEWDEVRGLPDTIDWTASTLDNAGNLLMTGNTYNSTEDFNIYTAKYNSEGSLEWEVEFDFDGERDYGAAIAVDENYNVYVAGAGLQNADGTFDYVVIKYDEEGVEDWSVSYDGADGLDIPTSISEDGSGNVYVTGTSEGDTTKADYLTLKFDSDGTKLWEARYDYAGGGDHAAGLIYGNDGDIFIAGGSEDSTGTQEYASIKYNAGGTFLTAHREPLPGISIDKPAAIAQDVNGNFYLTGSVSTNGLTYDMYTLKLDDSLHVEWTASYDGDDSLHDEPNAIAIDSEGNVYITGYTETVNGKEITTVKYSDIGVLEWKVIEETDGSTTHATATDIYIDADDKIYVTGWREVGSSTEVYTVCYNSDGEKLWQQLLDEGSGDDVLVDPVGNVYVTGRGFSGGGNSYLALKYSSYHRVITAALDTSGNESHVTDEIIIRFDEDSLMMDKINKREIKFGALKGFISANFISLIETKLDKADLMGNATTLKVYKELTPSDSICISWRGDTLEVEPFWASLVIRIPEGNEEFTGDIFEICDSLETLFPAIRWANPNALIQNSSNDTYYSNQDSYHGTFFNGGDINLHNAWIQYPQKGRADVRVGVYDSGIDWEHEDFMTVSMSTSFSDSKIKGGKDYIRNTGPVGHNHNPYGAPHGTQVAGIIGALTDNGIGVAGIAGGDMSANTPNPGVSLYSMQVTAGGGQSLDKVANGILEGTMGTFGIPKLHIMNHSWGATMKIDHIDLLENAVRFAFRNQIITVASRGNHGNLSTFTNPFEYPACFKDDWVLNISGADQFGFFHEEGNHLFSPPDNFTSSYGGNVDLAAPSNSQNIYSTRPNNNYGFFNMTSAAAPHVSGVVALMLSFCKEQNGVPDPTQEDVEWMLEATAVDITQTPCTPGVDERTGWGFLEAHEALKTVNKNFFDLIHLEDVFSQATLIYGNTNITLEKNYGPLPGGMSAVYNVDIFEVKKTFTFNLGSRQLAHLIGGGNVLAKDAVWVRNSSSNVWGLPANFPSTKVILPEVDIKIESFNVDLSTFELTVETVGYYYAVNSFPSSVSNADAADYAFLPQNINMNATNVNCKPKLAISFLVIGQNPTTIVDEFEPSFMVYPNPLKDHAEIRFSYIPLTDVQFSLSDSWGRKITDFRIRKQSNSIYVLETGNLSSGVYYLQTSVNGENLTSKLLITP